MFFSWFLLNMLRCPDTNHLDVSTMSVSRSDLTLISRMVLLHTLVLDGCKLRWQFCCMVTHMINTCYRETSLGFLGRVPSVTTLSLNNNNIHKLDIALNVRNILPSTQTTTSITTELEFGLTWLLLCTNQPTTTHNDNNNKLWLSWAKLKLS